MLSINFKSNVKEFTRGLDKIQKKQVPFATARALTWTAQDAQKGIIQRIPRIFNVSKKWWLKQQPTGIKITPAKKIRLISSVYTMAYFAALQEMGGTKRPHRSSILIIPTKKVPKSRRKSGGAKAMLKNKNVFSTKTAIFRKKGGKKRKNQKLELLYIKEQSANVRARFSFARTVKTIANRKFSRNFIKSLEMALKTAR